MTTSALGVTPAWVTESSKSCASQCGGGQGRPELGPPLIFQKVKGGPWPGRAVLVGRHRTLSGSLSSSMEMCDQSHNITMCPLCDKTCSYWKMSSACATARASHLFDNPATVFFSIFMALWGEQSAAPPPLPPGHWGTGDMG